MGVEVSCERVEQVEDLSLKRTLLLNGQRCISRKKILQ